MKVVVNGEVRDLDAGVSLAEVVSETGARGPRGVAVAVNGEVVPKSAWPTVFLSEDDRVEVLAAIGGG